MTFSPFWLGSESIPYDPESYSRGMNYGGQLNFMVPLDGSITERCKSIAKRYEEKMRIEYELSRVLKCAELMKKGFTLRHKSTFEHLCNDVVPIVLQPIKQRDPMAEDTSVEIKDPEPKVEEVTPVVTEPVKVPGKLSEKATRGTLDKR